MISQPDLFDKPNQLSEEESQRKSWKTCWNWDGPVVGGYAEISTPIVDLANGGSQYLYMLRVKMLELLPDGRWLAEVSDYEPHKGTRVILGVCDIWFDVYGERPANRGTKGE